MEETWRFIVWAVPLIDWYGGLAETPFREVSDALIQYRKVRGIREEQELLVTKLQDR